jgi:hypothetical protein
MRRTLVLAVAGVAAVACCGIALAAGALPFSEDGNTINGCYSSKGTVVLLTPDSPTCPNKYEPIQWSVTGPPGADGVDGADGAPGVSPTVTGLAQGDANCPAGGAAITDANGATAYVCSGANGADGEPFSGTFTSGQYSLSVTDDGITLSGPLSEKVVLDATGVTVESTSPVTIRSSTDVSVRGTVVSLKGDGTLTAEAGGVAEVKGAVVHVNGGGSCGPAARAGDQVVGTANGSSVTGQVVTGSPTVCVG